MPLKPYEESVYSRERRMVLCIVGKPVQLHTLRKTATLTTTTTTTTKNCHVKSLVAWRLCMPVLNSSMHCDLSRYALTAPTGSGKLTCTTVPNVSTNTASAVPRIIKSCFVNQFALLKPVKYTYTSL